MSNITTRTFHCKASQDIIIALIVLFLGVIGFFVLTSLYEDYASVSYVQCLFILYIVAEIFSVISCISGIFFQFSLHLTINRDEIIFSRGWLNKRTTTIPANKIRSCSKSSGVLQRACGTMDISITTAGDDSEVCVHNIANGEEAYQLISQLAKRNDR